MCFSLPLNPDGTSIVKVTEVLSEHLYSCKMAADSLKLPLAVISIIVLSTVQRAVFGAVESPNPGASNVCEYDIDLKKNTFHAKCQGQPLGVSVFADSASVTTTNMEPDSGKPGSRTQASQTPQPRPMSPAVPCYMPPFSNVPRMPGAVDAPQNSTYIQMLNNMKKTLKGHKSTIGNISSLLSRGDNDLRSDLEALRGMASDPRSVRESIIATMRNQYNFMRTAILAHNAELNQMLSLLESLVTFTTNSLNEAHHSQNLLQQQLQLLNRTMLAMRTTYFSKRELDNNKGVQRGKDKCPQMVSALGGGESITAPWDKGVVMTDTTHSSRIWMMSVDGETDLLLQYDSRVDILYNLVARYFSLPFYCEGTGHVVYRNALFCHKAGTRIIIKYNLKRMEIASEVELPTAGVNNTFPYQFGLKSDIDLAVDELGLWAIYSTKESAGKMVISKISPRTLKLETTWLTSFPKKLVGNSFMVCGILYATNSYEDTPTFVRYTYDTNNKQEAIHEVGNIIFNNAAAFNTSKQAFSVMLDYNPKEQKLYSWSKSQIQMFPVYFKKTPN